MSPSPPPIEILLASPLPVCPALEMPGCAVRHCDTPAAVREALAAGFAQVLVLDAGFPHSGALQLLRDLRADPDRSRLPILWLGSPVALDVLPEELGPDLFLPSPEPRSLRASVRTLLRLRERMADPTPGELSSGEAMLRSLLENAPSMMGVVELAPDGSDIFHILDNAYSERFFGVDRGETAGKWSHRDLGSSAATVRSFCEAYQEARRTGHPVRFTTGLPGAPDEEGKAAGTWLDVSVSHIGPGRDGRDRFCYTALDDTDRRRAEAALRESEERLLFALEAGRIGAWEWSIRSGRVAWSEGLERLHGLEPGSFAGTYEAFLELVHPEERERIVTAIRRAVDGDAPYELEFRAARPGGEVQWIATQAHVQRDADGKPLRMIGVTRDITAQKMADLARRESEQRFRTIVETATEGIWLLNEHAQITFVNPRMAEILGCRPEEMLGRRKWDFLFPEDASGGRDLFERRRQGLSEQVDLRFRHQQGHEVWTLMASRPLHDEAGRFHGALDLFTDITERKHAEQALREENRRKTEFLAMLAHELRNPLAPVVNAAEILRLHDSGDPVVRRQRDVIERNARHLTRLVDDLLEVSRINQGKIALRLQREELRPLVEQAVTSVRAQAEARQHRLRVSLPDAPVYLQVDGTRIVQVLVNLLKNAVKYTDPGGDISLEVEPGDGEVTFRVRDSGRGMEPELLHRAFDLFVQGEQDLARTDGGLGVGLTLVKHLVEMHGGTLAAASPGPGLGSEFTVRLPAEPRAAGAVAGPNGTAHPPETARRILVVEDNPDAAETLAELLQLWGHAVQIALTGTAALRMAAEHQPDIILLDLGLPDLDGYEVARRLRESGALSGVFLAALTGYGDVEHRERVEAAGFHQHLTKPVDPEALRKLLLAECAPALSPHSG